eukprot:GHVS01037606.1.p1 GENE.GHVS01037606.1~~GHVS01037606.1.p1  ORF type:complete len:129 (-),score=23.33 GHVS01037606.1:55-441(-)
MRVLTDSTQPGYVVVLCVLIVTVYALLTASTPLSTFSLLRSAHPTQSSRAGISLSDDSGNASSGDDVQSTAYRNLLPSRFGTSGGRSRDVFFNTGRLFDRGVTEVNSGQFAAAAIKGGCMGTRLQCGG